LFDSFPFKKIKNLGQDERRCIGLAVAENNIFDIFFDVARQFGEAIRNIMIGNCNSVPRSLRWILETIIFWANMLDENRDASEAFDHTKSYHTVTLEILLFPSRIRVHLRNKSMYLHAGPSGIELLTIRIL
jgi:hypothetical protein